MRIFLIGLVLVGSTNLYGSPILDCKNSSGTRSTISAERTLFGFGNIQLSIPCLDYRAKTCLEVEAEGEVLDLSQSGSSQTRGLTTANTRFGEAEHPISSMEWRLDGDNIRLDFLSNYEVKESGWKKVQRVSFTDCTFL